MDIFADLGAVRWEELAGQELRASGKTARKRDPSTAAILTPQELQVAGLVQQGMTNRDVAALLFLSPRTIDFHLRNVYVKLGISTRTELIRQHLGRTPAVVVGS
nr:helix-turn-helix transcriptional regulator [Arthrobacter sp. SF27]